MDYELDDDPRRVDAEVVWRFLSEEAYWARWRSRTDVERQLETAWRLVGCYESATGAMVGFARAVSDGVGFAYLADVFVLTEHRGKGLGARLLEAMIEDGPGNDFRWLLHTSDAHGLYENFGFRPADHKVMERPQATEGGPGGPPS